MIDECKWIDSRKISGAHFICVLFNLFPPTVSAISATLNTDLGASRMPRAVTRCIVARGRTATGRGERHPNISCQVADAIQIQ